VNSSSSPKKDRGWEKATHEVRAEVEGGRRGGNGVSFSRRLGGGPEACYVPSRGCGESNKPARARGRAVRTAKDEHFNIGFDQVGNLW